MSIVLHLIPADDWQQLADSEPVTNASLLRDGFIHCTDDPVVMLQVANAFYRGQPGDFIVLHVDVARLTSRCIWEQPAHLNAIGTGGPALAPTFPHVYGPIDRDAVLGVQAIMRDAQGRFTCYGELGPSI